MTTRLYVAKDTFFLLFVFVLEHDGCCIVLGNSTMRSITSLVWDFMLQRYDSDCNCVGGETERGDGVLLWLCVHEIYRLLLLYSPTYTSYAELQHTRWDKHEVVTCWVINAFETQQCCNNLFCGDSDTLVPNGNQLVGKAGLNFSTCWWRVLLLLPRRHYRG